MWDDERLRAFLDDVERGPHGGRNHVTQDEFDLPCALYDGPPSPWHGGAPPRDTDRAGPRGGADPAAVEMDLDDPFGENACGGDDEDDTMCDLAVDVAWGAPPEYGDVLRAMYTDEGPVDHYGNVAFIAAQRFDGRREGYVFRVGDVGLGYYLDMGPYHKGSLPDTSADNAGTVIHLMDHIDFTADFSPPLWRSAYSLCSPSALARTMTWMLRPMVWSIAGG